MPPDFGDNGITASLITSYVNRNVHRFIHTRISQINHLDISLFS